MKKLSTLIFSLVTVQMIFATEGSEIIEILDLQEKVVSDRQELIEEKDFVEKINKLNNDPSLISGIDNASFSSGLEELTRPSPEIVMKSPSLAVALSIVPGLGHLYLEDYWKAGEFMGTFGSEILLLRNQNVVDEVGSLLSSTTICTWGYGIYAAYRDARIMRSDRGYRYAMPKDELQDLMLAPFKPSIMKKPEVWGGLLGSLSLAVGVTYLSHTLKQKISPTLSMNRSLHPISAFPVGIWEEAFFRGYLQPATSEWATPTGGLVLSSMMFGAAHIPNFAFFDQKERRIHYMTTVPFITLMGAYMGWMAQKNQSLQESVALHAWYDFTLFSLGLLAEKASIGSSSFSFEYNF